MKNLLRTRTLASRAWLAARLMGGSLLQAGGSDGRGQGAKHTRGERKTAGGSRFGESIVSLARPGLASAPTAYPRASRTARPTSAVVAVPPRSGVFGPAAARTRAAAWRT